ncbi:hypothetical protein [Dinghuibacter silviterrae]|nr:hypothetical protein [Dinghuibacter silviterrae]
MMKQRMLFAYLLLMATLYMSCSKTGPAGPAGATGATGAAGPQGPQGATGTANVIYSNWNTAINLRDTNFDGSNYVLMTLLAPSLTSADLNTATVLVYFTFGDGDFPLPYMNDAGGKTSIISFIPEAGQILITRYTTDNSASVTLGTLNQYRFVIIPGGVNVPDSFDYATVCAFYHITEN